MSYETISVSRLTPHIGAEIGGIDLTKPLSNRQVQEVHDALIENQVIFFRDQPIDVPSLKTFGLHFGKLHIHPLKGVDGHPEVRKLHADASSKHVSGEEWHTAAVGGKKPAIRPSVVVLPQPEGPSSVTNSPSATARSIPATAAVAP